MENLMALNPKIMCSIMAKEVDDFQKQDAPVQVLIKFLCSCVRYRELKRRLEQEKSA
jgi:hypothetical protein